MKAAQICLIILLAMSAPAFATDFEQHKQEKIEEAFQYVDRQELVKMTRDRSTTPDNQLMVTPDQLKGIQERSEAIRLNSKNIMKSQAEENVQAQKSRAVARDGASAVVDEKAKADQKDREQKYRQSLRGQDIYQKESPAAAKAVKASRSKKMKDLESKYAGDIWANVEKEFNAQGREFDREYVDKFVEANRDEADYENKHLLVFLSRSVPEATIHNYLDGLSSVQGEVAYVLRGMVGPDPSKIMPTQRWVSKLLCGKEEYTSEEFEKLECDPGPVDINPNLFRQFGINQVPAVVYVPDPLALNSCRDDTQPAGKFYVFYGDMSPEYVLRQFVHFRPNDATLQKLYNRVRGESFVTKGGKS